MFMLLLTHKLVTKKYVYIVLIECLFCGNRDRKLEVDWIGLLLLVYYYSSHLTINVHCLK